MQQIIQIPGTVTVAMPAYQPGAKFTNIAIRFNVRHWIRSG